MRACRALSLLPFVAAVAAATPTNDIAQAWSYDDLWQSAWTSHCQALLAAGTGKTAGFVLEIGDNTSRAPQYAQWIRSGAGRTTAAQTLHTISIPADTAIRSWALVDAGAADSSSSDGLWLARTDVSSHRTRTAAAGLDTNELLSGDGNGGTAMPDVADQATARTTLADAAYTDNIRLSTLLTAYSNAQFAVVEIGTYDALNGSINVATFHANLRSIIDQLEAKDIVPILSTIPPNADSAFAAKTDQINDAVRATAHERDVPLIDLAQEILNRQPTAWSTTLVSGNVLSFEETGGAVNSASDPYQGGDPATYTTGDNAANVGYLLRDWLTFQKLKEVKLSIVDMSPTNTTLVSSTAGGSATTTGGTTTGGTTTGPVAMVSGGQVGHHGCGRGGGGGLIVAAGLCLAAGLRRQRR